MTLLPYLVIRLKECVYSLIEMISYLPLAKISRFLWVYFQIIELCDAASDEGVRDILEHLPEGLYETYSRIFRKIAKTRSNPTVLKIMKWMVCSKRLLRVEELQEAVAFDPHDKSWNADKIPDADRMIKSCYGLVVRDSENDIVRLAHHTVQQYLVSPQGSTPDLCSEGFEDPTRPMARVHFWPELYEFRCDPRGAEVLVGTLCMTYLCFSDFSTAVSRTRDDGKVDLAAAFKDRGPVSIPAALGLGKYFGRLPYMFFGSRNNFKMPDIDYSKYLSVSPRDRRPSPDFRKKFALLDYVIENWPWHTRWLESSELRLTTQFWDLVQDGTIAFEFRPWGSNQHFGQYGCRGCPLPEPDELESKDLPSMGFLHWAAETGHLKVFDIIKPPLQKYLEHERHYDETLLIACRHGQVAVVDILLDRGTFDLSDGRAIVAACASGNALTFYHLTQAQEAKQELERSIDYFASVGPRALYEAASNGHKDVVESLLAMKANPFIGDTATGLTPFQIAAKNGHPEVVEALLNLAPPSAPSSHSMDPPHEINGMKALHYAAENGFSEVVRHIALNRISGFDDKDLLGETPLIKAARNGQANMAKTLLEAGADPFTKGGENYDVASHVFCLRPDDRARQIAPKPTATHHAAANGHENVIAVLPYSDWTCGDQAITALHLGAAYGYPDAVQTLLCKGAGIETRELGAMTALHYASCNGHGAVVQLLLNKGCSLEARADIRLTALHMAACTAKNEIVKLLLAHGAAIGAKTPSLAAESVILLSGGSTSLHLAATYADADTIRTLVNSGASLEEKDQLGRTALDVSAQMDGNSANIEILIDLGAKWLCRNALVHACRKAPPKIAEVLADRISKLTPEQQQHAALIIGGEMKDKARVNALLNWAQEWERKQKVSGFRR